MRWTVAGHTDTFIDKATMKGFSKDTMSSLTAKWRERRGRTIPGMSQNGPQRPVWMEWSGWFGRWLERSRGKADQIMKPLHVTYWLEQDTETQRGGGQVAIRQERWQYVGIAGSQFNSYASILPPLQFQVIRAILRLSVVTLFHSLSFHLREGKHTR